MQKPKQKYPIVEIIWEDIGSPSGWIKPGHDSVTSDPILITSVGFLILDTPEYIVYASDVAYDGEINGRTQVPHSNVKKMKVLRKVPGEKAKDIQVIPSQVA